jgi:protein involved in polysaccharide export with SLBB domain/outer membrane protein OmpA-like peptidoglycan-associated protein
MLIVSTRVKIINTLILLTILVGCGNVWDTERPPFKGPEVRLHKSDPVWSMDFGPEKSGHFRSLTLGDFNNDGKIDIVGGSYEPGAIFLWHGDNAGNWKRAQRFKISGDTRALAAGDINNDGWLDIVSTSMGNTNGVHAWINENGKFGDSQPISEKDLFDGLRLADVNNDGKLDVIAANKTGVVKGGVYVWLGTGKGNFIQETGPTRVNMYSDVEVGDFNNDGKIDIVGAAWGHDGGALRVWLGSGDGRWSAVESIVDIDSFWGVDVADVNGDGNPDIISAANFDGVKIHFGDGKGDFSKKKVLSEKGNFWRAKAVDLNNDGLLDIVATLSDNHGIIVWYQTSGIPKDEEYSDNSLETVATTYGGWVAKDEGLPKEGYYFDLGFADFNSDNKLDIAVTTYGEGVKTWLRGIDDLAELKTENNLVEKEEEMKPPVPVFYTSVFFDTKTTDLSAESITILNNLLNVLNSVEGTVVKILKHTGFGSVDSKQSPTNHVLSEARFRTVTDFFISKGISQERIEIDTRIDSNLANEGGDGSAWQEGRRIDIALNYGKSLDNKQEDKTKFDANPESDETGKYAYPFVEKGDLIPVKEYKAWREVDGIPEYRIGPKDQLSITFWIGLDEKKYEVTVSPQNTVSFSYIKNFNVTGFTPTELEEEFTKELSKVFRDPFVKVEIPDRFKKAYRLSIFGAVRSLPRQPTGPGIYRLYGKERFSEFLARAGGHLPTADLTHVRLVRDRKTYFLNVFDALFRSDYRQDVIVEDGDVFFIPSKTEIKNRVFVMGEVQRPGLFSFDKDISLLEAVISAGGPTVYAKARQALVIRGSVERPETIKVNLMDIFQRGDFRKNIPLNNGDVVYVARNILGDIRNFVRAFQPFVQLANLPYAIYDGAAFPKIDGVPFEREPSPSVSTIIQNPPMLKGGPGAWQGQSAK